MIVDKVSEPSSTIPPTSIPLPTDTPIPTATPTPVPAARLEIGYQAFSDGDFDRAVTEFQNAVTFSQDEAIKAQAMLMLGRIAFMKQKADSALEFLRPISGMAADMVTISDSHYFLGEIYDSLDRYPEAALEYAAAVEIHSSALNAFLLEKQGESWSNAGEYSKAVDAFIKAISFSGGSNLDYDLAVAKNLALMGDKTAALERYNFVYNATSNEYTRAQVDLLVGQIYLSEGQTEAAYQQFQDAVINYPRAYDSYSALAALIEAGVNVDQFNRGLVDFYAGQNIIAAEVLLDYYQKNPAHDGSPHYFRALALTNEGQYADALAEWDQLISDHPSDRFYSSAWDEKAYTLWFYLGKYEEAATTLLTFINQSPQDGMAAQLLFEAGRIYERANMLEQAAAVWERLPNEYPASDYAYLGIYLSGITYYRLNYLDPSTTAFQRALLLASAKEDKAAANLWLGKIAQKTGNTDGAQSAWQSAMEQDPTGYYSERARHLLTGISGYEKCDVLDLGINLESERPEAEAWLKKTFNIAPETNLRDQNSLVSDARIILAHEYWRIGLQSLARNEIENYQEEFKNDPTALYKLTSWLLEQGIYRNAILSARQILNLAGLDDVSTLNAPIFFNHIRFGPYYRDIIIQASDEQDIDPLLIYGLIRQESMFESFITSSAGAEGLMQMMPVTAHEVVTGMAWPADFSDNDIYRPVVAIRMGAYYLSQQIRNQNGIIPAALAAYNGGPGNATTWWEMSNGDTDLFLEVVRFRETRNYIRAVVENYNIYRSFYCR